MYLQKYFPRAPAVSAVGMVSWGFSHAMMALSPCVLSHHCSFDMQDTLKPIIHRHFYSNIPVLG